MIRVPSAYALEQNRLLIADLNAAGYPVRSLQELVGLRVAYRSGVPILLKWLDLTEDIRGKEMIVRALSVPWAKKDALDPLIAFFKTVGEWDLDAVASEDHGRVRSLAWATGNALWVLWDDRRFEELTSLARNSGYGNARQMIVLGMGKSKRPDVVPLLVELLKDPDVTSHAVTSLGQLRAAAARPALKSLLDDPRPLVRREARKALKRMDALPAQ